jgi:hypothetical protein
MNSLIFSKFKRKTGDTEKAIREADRETDYLLRALLAVCNESPEEILAHAAAFGARHGKAVGECLEWLWSHGYPRSGYRWSSPRETCVGQLLDAEDKLAKARGTDKQLKAFVLFVRGQLQTEEGNDSE